MCERDWQIVLKYIVKKIGDNIGKHGKSLDSSWKIIFLSQKKLKEFIYNT